MTGKRLEGRIAVITGGSSGLGRATALRFAEHGARVVCADLKSAGVEEEIQKKHSKDSATFIKCDVTQESDIEALVKEAAAWGGRVDIMCNYAGVGIEARPEYANKRAHDIPTEAFDKTYAINTRGVWLSCKYAIKQMLEQEPREPNARGERTRGWVLNAASMLGLITFPGTPAYTPSKHAVVGMTKSMGVDYAQDRIHVNCLCPGFVRTPMIMGMIEEKDAEAFITGRHPWNSLGTAEDIADAALFLCSDEAAWITGHSMVIDGGYTAQ